MLSREWRCSWSSADRRCSNYIWVIDNFIPYWGASYIRGFTVSGTFARWKIFHAEKLTNDSSVPPSPGPQDLYETDDTQPNLKGDMFNLIESTASDYGLSPVGDRAYVGTMMIICRDQYLPDYCTGYPHSSWWNHFRQCAIPFVAHKYKYITHQYA